MPNDKEENNIDLSLVDKVLATSDSQKDRGEEELDNTKDLNLVKLLNNQLDKAKTKNLLKEAVVTKIKERVDDTTDGNEISTNALIHLLEILEKSDTDLTLGIISAGKDHAFLQALKGKREEGVNFSKEDIELVKKLSKAIGYLETVTKNEGE